MSSSPAASTGFIHEVVLLAGRRATERECQSFISDVIRHSGLDYSRIDATTAEYRVLMNDSSLRSGLRSDALLDFANESIPVSQLLGRQLAYSREQLIAAVWSMDSFASLRRFLAELRAITRFVHDHQDRLVGLVVPCEQILKIMDAIEQGQVAPPHQTSLPEQVTRQFGLRRKVLLLDYERRARLIQEPEDGFLRTLGRTLTNLR